MNPFLRDIPTRPADADPDMAERDAPGATDGDA
jgi:hypothetical protein